MASDVIRRLRDANERSVVVHVLDEFLSKTIEQDDKFVYKTILMEFHSVSKLLTAAEVELYIERLLSAGELIDSLVAALEMLTTSQMTSSMFPTIIKFVNTKMEIVFVDSLLLDNRKDSTFEMHLEFVSLLSTTRDRISNICMKFKTEERKRDEMITLFENSLSSSLIKTLETAYNRLETGKDIDMRVVSFMVLKCRNVSIKTQTLLSFLLQWLATFESNPLWDRLTQRILTDNSHGTKEFESLVINVCLAAPDATMLARCFGYSISSSPVIHRVCCIRLLIQRVCSDGLVCALCEYISCNGGSDLFLNCFKNIATVWSNPATVRFSSSELQRYLTRVVLHFIKKMKSLKVDNGSQLFPLIIEGVQERLSSPDISIRQSGMFVGEYCSDVMKVSDETLNFDYTDDEWLEEMRRIVSTEVIKETKVVPTTLPESISNTHVPSMNMKEVSEALDSDDEEDFAGYDVPESERQFEKLKEGEEPEKKCSAPHYIRECLEHLDEKEKYEVFEASFNSLNDKIRRKAIGFEDIAPQLVQKLVFLTDKFSSKLFEETRLKCLVSCLVMMPVLAPSIGDLIFSRSAAFFHKYLILEAFLTACKELSSPPVTSSAPEVVVEVKSNKEHHWQEIVDARIREKTRYFGKKRPVVVESVNRLSSVATLFFYPLLRTTTDEHLQLKGKDSAFLSRVLYTAAEILQLARSSPSVVKMADSLATLTLPLRFHDDSFVRMAVMFCYYSISEALSDEVFRSIFASSASNWLEWACDQSENTEISQQDKQIAHFTASSILRKLKQPEDLPPL